MLEIVASAVVSALTATFVKDLIDVVRKARKTVRKIISASRKEESSIDKTKVEPTFPVDLEEVKVRLKAFAPRKTIHTIDMDLALTEKERLKAFIRLVLWQIVTKSDWEYFYNDGLAALPRQEARYLLAAVDEIVAQMEPRPASDA